jgi:hypothetical protein
MRSAGVDRNVKVTSYFLSINIFVGLDFELFSLVNYINLDNVKLKLKFTLEQAVKAQGGLQM